MRCGTNEVCQYYKKTGYCDFRLNCRYIHEHGPWCKRNCDQWFHPMNHPETSAMNHPAKSHAHFRAPRHIALARAQARVHISTSPSIPPHLVIPIPVILRLNDPRTANVIAFQCGECDRIGAGPPYEVRPCGHMRCDVCGSNQTRCSTCHV